MTKERETDVNDDVWDIQIESWGPTPGKGVLVLRTHLGLPIQQLHQWLRTPHPVVARGVRTSLGPLLIALEGAGVRYRMIFIPDAVVVVSEK